MEITLIEYKEFDAMSITEQTRYLKSDEADALFLNYQSPDLTANRNLILRKIVKDNLPLIINPARLHQIMRLTNTYLDRDGDSNFIPIQVLLITNIIEGKIPLAWNFWDNINQEFEDGSTIISSLFMEMWGGDKLLCDYDKRILDFFLKHPKANLHGKVFSLDTYMFDFVHRTTLVEPSIMAYIIRKGRLDILREYSEEFSTKEKLVSWEGVAQAAIVSALDLPLLMPKFIAMGFNPNSPEYVWSPEYLEKYREVAPVDYLFEKCVSTYEEINKMRQSLEQREQYTISEKREQFKNARDIRILNAKVAQQKSLVSFIALLITVGGKCETIFAHTQGRMGTEREEVILQVKSVIDTISRIESAKFLSSLGTDATPESVAEVLHNKKYLANGKTASGEDATSLLMKRLEKATNELELQKSELKTAEKVYKNAKQDLEQEKDNLSAEEIRERKREIRLFKADREQNKKIFEATQSEVDSIKKIINMINEKSDFKSRPTSHNFFGQKKPFIPVTGEEDPEESIEKSKQQNLF